MPRTFDPVRERIRKILLEEWDPANAAQFEAARGEYDSYVDPLHDLIAAGADEDAIIDFLMERQREIMCFPPLDRGPLRRPARMLAALWPEREVG